MALYEHVFLARQDLSQAQVDALAATATEIVEANQGKVTKTETWGLKNLAYKIKRNRKAHFVLLNIEAPAGTVAELERQTTCDTTAGLMGRLDNKELVLILDQPLAALPAALARYHAELPDPRRLVFKYRASESPVAGVLKTVSALGLSVTDVRTTETDLEDIFLQLTRGSRDAAS